MYQKYNEGQCTASSVYRNAKMLQWPFRDDEIRLTGNCMMKPPLLFVDWQEDSGENIISSTLFPIALETKHL